MDRRQVIFAPALVGQTLTSAGVGFTAAQRTDIENPGRQRQVQRHIIGFGIMGQGNNRRVTIRLQVEANLDDD